MDNISFYCRSNNNFKFVIKIKLPINYAGCKPHKEGCCSSGEDYHRSDSNLFYPFTKVIFIT